MSNVSMVFAVKRLDKNKVGSKSHVWTRCPRTLFLIFSVVVFLGFSGCRVLRTGVGTVEEEITPGITLGENSGMSRGLGVLDICAFENEEISAEPIPMKSNTISELVERVKPAVLNIYVKTLQPVSVYLLGVPIPGTKVNLRGESLGSGFICSPRGFVLSNAHVVERASGLFAKTYDGSERGLEVVAVDRSADLALLRLVDNDNYAHLPMVSSKTLKQGDWVIAIGNPLGFNHLVSHGIYSQRYVPKESDSGIPELIISDTPINPGNSGGPLIDIHGRAVGINTAVLINTEGISLTIPSERVRQFLEEVVETVN